MTTTPEPPNRRPQRRRRRRRLSIDDYVQGVLKGDRGVLARAITLIESRKDSDRPAAQAVLQALLPHTGAAVRVGITGVPGVGKSTFIDAFGMHLLEQGHRVAVLAVDPSSAISGGSIMGDKTRMQRLGMAEAAFVRPSPSGLSLGGVTRRTRESLLLCEAAGYDVILIETVGVGQSETVVAEMVDTFLVLMLPGAGDELQGIKRGILEMADILAVNKADGDNRLRAQAARQEYQAALRYLHRRDPHWKTPVPLISGQTGEGLPEIWETIGLHRAQLQETGTFNQRRSEQRLRWMWDAIEEQLLSAFHETQAVQAQLKGLEAAVKNGERPPTVAAEALIAVFRESYSSSSQSSPS
ncbi:MAG: methylmalonyl Co-A mutase-associated GTPase MeaB [Myxococcota bacterium]